MALPSSGPLSLSSIQTEFGGSNPISISEYYRNGGFVPSNNTNVPISGEISVIQFYGAVKQFTVTISSSRSQFDLRSTAVSAGWDEITPLAVVINSGVYVSSNSTGVPALAITGSFPGGVSLINNGFIVGMGGNGGNGASVAGNGGAGSSGWTALYVGTSVSITNNGTIAGGGGGGGGGPCSSDTWSGGNNVTSYYADYAGGGGGGGGRSGTAFSSYGGGPGGTRNDSGSGNFNDITRMPTSGGSGTHSSAGSAGLGTLFTYATPYGGDGGAGGEWGASGGLSPVASLSGTYWNISNLISYTSTRGAAGSGGAAVVGNSNITWVATGTRLGAIT